MLTASLSDYFTVIAIVVAVPALYLSYRACMNALADHYEEYLADVRNAPANLAAVLAHPGTVDELLVYETRDMGALLIAELTSGTATCVARTDELAGALHALEQAGLNVSTVRAQLYPA